MSQEQDINVQKLITELGGIDFKGVISELDLVGDERTQLLKHCNLVASSPNFKIILKALIDEQKNFSTTKAANYEEVTFGRAIIVGLLMYETFCREHSKQYEGLAAGEKEEIEPGSIL